MHEEIKKLVALMRRIKAENFKEPASYPSMKLPEEMFEAVKAYARDAVRAGVDTDDKTVRDTHIDEITADVQAHFAEQFPDSVAQLNEVYVQTGEVLLSAGCCWTKASAWTAAV